MVKRRNRLPTRSHPEGLLYVGIAFALCLHFGLAAKVLPSSSGWPMRQLPLLMKVVRA